MKNSIIRFRHSIIALLMIVINGAGAEASAPWTVNPNDYRYDMTVYLDVKIDSEQLDYSRYVVAAFYGNECRGIAEPLALGNGRECLYLRIRSNQESGETMTFKYYEEETEKTYVIPKVSIQFESNELIGYPSRPFIIDISSGTYYELSIYLNDELISSEMVEYGSKLEIQDPEVPEGMRFDGWIDSIPEYMPAHNVEIHGIYTEASGVAQIEYDDSAEVTVYDPFGRLLHSKKAWREAKHELREGVYVVNGIKRMVKK